MAESVKVSLSINGVHYSEWCEARMTLADFIRVTCGLTGTHLGCEHGVCGACTVLLNGESVRSCLMFAVQAEGASIETIEGLSTSGELSWLQQKFREHHALQCGFCTPGMLMTATELLSERGQLSEEIIRDRMAGNLCRCTGYQSIVEAITAAADDA